MKIGLIQACPEAADGHVAWESYGDVICDASAAGCRLVVLPELADIGYRLDWVKANQVDVDPYVPMLKRMARERNLYVMAGMLERSEEHRWYNSVGLISPEGELVGTYRKRRRFRGEWGREADWFDAGSECVTWLVDGLCCSPMICYDLRFASFAKVAKQRGAKLLVYVAAWPEARISDWSLLLRARAIEHGVHVMGVNYSEGYEPGGVPLGGRSVVYAPDGTMLLGAPADYAGLLEVDLPGLGVGSDEF